MLQYQSVFIVTIFYLQYFCKSCIGNSEAFIFRNMKMGKVCPSCDIKYCEENKSELIYLDIFEVNLYDFPFLVEIMEADSVAELAKLQNTVTDGECCVCNKLKHEDYKCSSCSQVRIFKYKSIASKMFQCGQLKLKQ